MTRATEWYKIWVDDGGELPDVMLMVKFADQDEILVYNLKEFSVEFSSSSEDEISRLLSEDEFICITDKMYVPFDVRGE